jgi:hypothetical protein
MLQATLLVLELGGFEPRMQIKGVICVIDLQNISMRQALYLTPNVAQKIVEFGMVSCLSSSFTTGSCYLCC